MFLFKSVETSDLFSVGSRSRAIGTFRFSAVVQRRARTESGVHEAAGARDESRMVAIL